MVYNYFFGHSRSMSAAKVGSNHCKFSISIDSELMNVIVTNNDNIDELYTRSLNSYALCDKEPRTGFVDVTVSSLRGCRPGGGARGCKTNNACTRVHAALNGQVSCLSCIFSTGQYSSLDFNDLCFPNITNNATCPPSRLGPIKDSSEQFTDQHEPYGHNSNLSSFSLSFSFNDSYYYKMDGGGGGEKILTTSLQTDNTVASSTIKNGIEVQITNGLSTVTNNTYIDHLVVNREFGFMLLAMTKQIYNSNDNVHIECQDKALHLNKVIL